MQTLWKLVALVREEEEKKGKRKRMSGVLSELLSSWRSNSPVNEGNKSFQDSPPPPRFQLFDYCHEKTAGEHKQRFITRPSRAEPRREEKRRGETRRGEMRRGEALWCFPQLQYFLKALKLDGWFNLNSHKQAPIKSCAVWKTTKNLHKLDRSGPRWDL